MIFPPGAGVFRLPNSATVESRTFPFDRMEAIREPFDPVEGQAMISWVCIVWFALGIITGAFGTALCASDGW